MPKAQRPRTDAQPERSTERSRRSPPDVAALRSELAAVILAALVAPTLAEQRRLTARRNELGRELARWLKAVALTAMQSENSEVERPKPSPNRRRKQAETLLSVRPCVHLRG